MKQITKISLLMGLLCFILSALIAIQIRSIRGTTSIVGESQTTNQLRDSVLEWREKYEQALNLIKKQIDDMKTTKFTKDEVENAKELIVSTVKGIEDSQDAEITYYFGQELSKQFTEIEQYVENIKKIQPEDVNNIAKKIKINTIYFLRD